MLLKPLLTPLLTPLARSVFDDKRYRNYLTFNGINSYIQLSEPKAFTGDFEIGATIVAHTETVRAWYVIAQGGLGKIALGVMKGELKSTVVKIKDGPYSGLGVELGAESKVSAVFTVTGSVYSVEYFVNGSSSGVLATTIATDSGIAEITELGRWYTSSSDLTVYDTYLTDLTTPSNSVFIPINNGWADNPDITDSDGNIVGALINGQESDWSRGNVL